MSAPKSFPRIVRRERPSRRFKRTTYRAAFPFLMAEFGGRCAYSDQHVSRAGGESVMEVDHFDPRRKQDVVQDYFNLLLATRHCNLAKSSYWPSAADRKCGLRLLDPTREMDWGVHVFEDPETHLLWGRTPAGNLHIRQLDLNARHLVDERRDRGQILRLLAEQPIKLKSVQFEVPNALPELRRQLESMIRLIPQEPMPASHPFRLGLSGRRG